MYYKVIQDKKIIDVLDSLVFVRKQIVHGLLIICTQDYAEGLLSSDGNSIWFSKDFIDDNIHSYPEVSVIEIEELEYTLLKRALEANKEVVEEIQQEPETEINDISEDAQISLDYLIVAKIDEMSETCNAVILNGFDITLSDNCTHHFDLSLEEQLNIMTLKEMITSGVTAIPYHASNEPCKFYSVEDIMSIITAATELKTYQITYFNSLKQYIKSISTLEELNQVYYGMPIPAKYYSEVMVSLVSGQGIGDK